LRVGEALGLNIANIDFENRIIWVKESAYHSKIQEDFCRYSAGGLYEGGRRDPERLCRPPDVNGLMWMSLIPSKLANDPSVAPAMVFLKYVGAAARRTNVTKCL
jgi:hypothetical protein